MHGNRAHIKNTLFDKRNYWGPCSLTGFALAVSGFLSDRVSKWYLLDIMDMVQVRVLEVTPFLNLVMVWNRGVSYGLFQADTRGGQAILSGFAGVAVVFLSVWLARSTRPLMGVALGLIIGGALGNVYDRVKFGAVADFFSFHAHGFYWYVFNVADIWISMGVGLIVYDAVFPARRKT